MHLALSDPKDQNSPRHIRTFGRTEDLVKGELLLDKETETNTYREIDSDDKKKARADQALADMSRAEDAVRLAPLQATEPLRDKDRSAAAAGDAERLRLGQRKNDQAP